MSMMLQSEESEDVCGGIEELAVSIPVEYEPCICKSGICHWMLAISHCFMQGGSGG